MAKCPAKTIRVSAKVDRGQLALPSEQAKSRLRSNGYALEADPTAELHLDVGLPNALRQQTKSSFQGYPRLRGQEEEIKANH